MYKGVLENLEYVPEMEENKVVMPDEMGGKNEIPLRERPQNNTPGWGHSSRSPSPLRCRGFHPGLLCGSRWEVASGILMLERLGERRLLEIQFLEKTLGKTTVSLCICETM
jgi:hypothetical protein